MKIKDIPLQNRPRERLLRNGSSALSDAEILALVIQKGSKEENVVDMCNRLLGEYGIEKLSELSITEMQKIKGIGPAKAMQIVGLFEFNKRHSIAKRNGLRKTIEKSEDIFHMFHDELKDKKKEHLYALYLDSNNQILEGPKLISLGILDSSLIHPREVFKEAIKRSAKSLILIHNHPSENNQPSQNDIEITEKIRKGSDLMSIKLLDHIIISYNGYYSFNDNKLL